MPSGCDHGEDRAAVDAATTARATRLREMIAKMIRTQSPQERDRMLQQHLAQARGRERNAMLLRQMTAFVLQLRAGRRKDPDE